MTHGAVCFCVEVFAAGQGKLPHADAFPHTVYYLNRCFLVEVYVYSARALLFYNCNEDWQSIWSKQEFWIKHQLKHNEDEVLACALILQLVQIFFFFSISYCFLIVQRNHQKAQYIWDELCFYVVSFFFLYFSLSEHRNMLHYL